MTGKSKGRTLLTQNTPNLRYNPESSPKCDLTGRKMNPILNDFVFFKEPVVRVCFGIWRLKNFTWSRIVHEGRYSVFEKQNKVNCNSGSFGLWWQRQWKRRIGPPESQTSFLPFFFVSLPYKVHINTKLCVCTETKDSRNLKNCTGVQERVTREKRERKEAYDSTHRKRDRTWRSLKK